MFKLRLRTIFLALLMPFLQAEGASQFAVGFSPVSKVFTPISFFNDPAQVVIYGYFLDSCFSIGSVRHRVQGKQVNVNIHSYRAMDLYCLQVITPYTKVVDLGILPENSYRVQVNESSYGILSVRHQQFLYNNSFYAPVKYVLLDAERKNILIAGEFSYSCLAMRSVKVLYDQEGDTINILPIAGPLEGTCRKGKFAFMRKIPLPRDLKRGPTLIHVKAMGGQSINKVEEF